MRLQVNDGGLSAPEAGVGAHPRYSQQPQDFLSFGLDQRDDTTS